MRRNRSNPPSDQKLLPPDILHGLMITSKEESEQTHFLACLIIPLRKMLSILTILESFTTPSPPPKPVNHRQPRRKTESKASDLVIEIFSDSEDDLISKTSEAQSRNLLKMLPSARLNPRLRLSKRLQVNLQRFSTVLNLQKGDCPDILLNQKAKRSVS